MRALNGDGDFSEAGIVRAQELLEYVTRQVPRLTDQVQHPRHGVDYTDEFPLANLNLPGPDYQVPEEPRDLLSAGDHPALGTTRRKAELKVYGAAKDGELYLLAGEEQRSLGRALASGNVLVVDDLKPGDYSLIQQHEGRSTTWEISLEPGSQSFDLRTGAFR